MGESIQCWQCGTRMTLDELANNDGDCPRCEVEVHLAEYLDNALSKVATLEAELAKLRAELERLPVDGWKLVPVERITIALESVQNAMEDAYNNAYQECCGRGQGQCCGDPVAAWSDADTAIMDALAPAQRELSALLAAAPSAPKADERPLYTCIGKGGEYRYLGTAIGAGDSRGELAEVYQDRTGQLFHRTPEDFMERMEPIAAARQEGWKV